eukprot:GHRR01018430.1.p1 GENE.GHRR01018430.1~~GHRR01018430.1.p1  ORF type:complete len:147 (+),score=59.72 GHRR01018430.1:219-659(+)
MCVPWGLVAHQPAEVLLLHVTQYLSAYTVATWPALPLSVAAFSLPVAVPGGAELRLSDLLDGLGAAGGSSQAAAAGLGVARKLLEKLDKKSQPVSAPLPRTVAERLDRKAGYDDTKQEVTKWQPIVKVSSQLCQAQASCIQHSLLG